MAETSNQIPLCRCCHKNGVFKSLFYDVIYNENEIENYSQMLYDTFGISFELSERDNIIYTICDECIEKLRISTEFKIACGKNIKREPLFKNDVTIKIEKMWNCASSNEGVSVRKARDIRENKCNVCNKTFKHKGHLENHVRTHEGYKCQICPEILANKRELAIHIVEQHQSVKVHKEAHECQQCGRKFTTKRTLLRHCQLRHTGVKPYVCQLCDKPFSSKWELHQHSAVHVALKPYTCNLCDKAYKGKQNFKMHMLMHTGTKPFQCSVCGRRFISKYCLSMHMRAHNSDKPYKCDICKKIFKYKWSLRRHMSDVHLRSKPTPIECDICKKIFKYKGSLRRHMSLVHKALLTLSQNINVSI